MGKQTTIVGTGRQRVSVDTVVMCLPKYVDILLSVHGICDKKLYILIGHFVPPN